MTRYTPLWEQQGQYAASQDRKLLAAIFAGNTPNNPGDYTGGMRVTVASGMTVNIAPGQAVVHAASEYRGSILMVSDAVEQVTLAPAPPSGQSRIDGIVAQARGNDLDGGSNNDFIMTVIQGTPAASNPPYPTVPSQAALLAWVNVPGAAVNLVAGNIYEARLARLSGLMEPALAAGDPFTSFTDPWGEVWVAKGGVLNGAWHKARDVLHSSATRNAAYNITTSPTHLALDGIISDPFGIYSSGWTLPLAGMWQIGGYISINAPASSGFQIEVYINSGLMAAFGGAVTGIAYGGLRIGCGTIIRKFNAGDILQIFTFGSAAAAGIYTSSLSTAFQMDYVGTG